MTNPPCWEPPRPIGSRWQRMGASVQLMVSVAAIVGGNRAAATDTVAIGTAAAGTAPAGTAAAGSGTAATPAKKQRRPPAPRSRSAAGDTLRA